MNTLHDWFRRRLRRFSAVRRHLLNAALGYRLAAWSAAIGALALLLLSGWIPNAFVNLGLALVATLALVTLALRYVLRRQRFQSPLDEAFEVEALVGSLNSRVVSAWDFLEQKLDDPLTSLVVERAKDDLDQPLETHLDRRERDQRRKQFAMLFVVLIALGFSPWFGYPRLIANLHRSWLEARDWLFPVHYVLEPEGDRHIRRLGETLPLRLRFDRRAYEQVTLITEQEGVEPQSTTLDVNSEGLVEYPLTSSVEVEYRVRFTFGSRETPPLACIFTTAPTLVNMQTELVSPAYTGQLPRSLEGIQQRLLGLPGSRLTLGFTFSKELEGATIAWDDGTSLPLEVVGRFASVGLVHQQARQASLQVRDRHGLALDDPLVIDFDLLADEKPQVFLPRHLKDDMPMLAEGVPLFGFGVRAQDDYGVTRCVLKWQRATVDSPNSIRDSGEVERLISPSQRNAIINFERVFESLTLASGDKVSFEVEVADNRTPDKQITKSRRYSFFIYQDDLGKLSIAQLGFGGTREVAEGRIGKSQKATAVKSPEGLRTKELVRNEFEGAVTTSTQAPTARGEFGRAVQDYFRVLSGAKEDEPASTKPAPAPATTPPPEASER